MDRGLSLTAPREATDDRTDRLTAKKATGHATSQRGFRDVHSPHGRGDKSQVAEAETLRSLSISPAPGGRLSPIPHGPYHPPGGIHVTTGMKSSLLKRFWTANKPAILVALSQLFGATMNLSARFLELEGEGMHPVQMLLVRQAVTSICCLAYMWWVSIPNYPFGKKEIRWLLLVRGCTGFFGIFGMWWSMMYLPLADATVITFLAPGVAGFVCYFLLREPFTRLEQLATLVALLGVVLIAQPVALFATTADAASSSSSSGRARRAASIPGADHETTPRERLLAVGVALIGVLGAAGAFTTLRAIGKRAHPLISVNAFAVICTIICVTALGLGPVLDIGQPSLRWIAPTSLKQWLLLLSLGGLGFVMQYLLTAGLAADKSNRANAMIYTHMLFAASFDRWIFGRRMGLMSFAGCTLILGSAVGVIFMKRAPAPPKAEDVERQSNLSGEAEGSPMLVGVAGHTESVNLERIR
ncbi:Integral membrane family protein [Metarhizium guizhouense ARSEF 977]|uniref:Integral membrane family protein n=1 Tax=Metarhizium guizhouense (strain ARSEF 977) TaxID=1276136 RepID=A0A0B4IBI1_METGA|nr:Integral membrane family protein [Metarhizium guizhouense ARSEF 977]